MIHHQTSPRALYREVGFDARILGGDRRDLVALCHEQFDQALGEAIRSETASDNARKSAALTRALAALTALQLGLAGDGAVRTALETLYAAARHTILDCALDFDTAAIAAIRRDFAEVGAAMLSGGSPPSRPKWM